MNPENGLWVLHPTSGLDGILQLTSLGIAVPLAALYEDVLPGPGPA